MIVLGCFVRKFIELVEYVLIKGSQVQERKDGKRESKGRSCKGESEVS
jgi:hypothetical protein